MDKLKAMQTFVHIADEGSLTAAARSRDSSLPAVVRTLAALEAHLGVRLFHRTTRRISLTEEGKHYLENCRQVLAAVDDAEAALSADAAEPTGQLTLTAPVLFGQMYVAPAVMRFVQRFERMRCSLVLLDRVVNLLEEGMDAGIRIGPLEDSSLVAQPLGSLRRVVVASPTYLRRHGVPQHPKDLLKANCVRFLGSSGPWWTFHENGRAFTVPVTGNLDFNHNAPVLDACLAGMGFGMFISYQVAPYLAQEKLQLVLETFEPPPRPVSVVYPHARMLPARTRAFIDFIKLELNGLKSL
ncbi:LysR family transcriptional regulator [Rhodoferax ferrireducens]|uniref:LysR family transcriptional regulator n=1 Tax=Rhodoferax ferrireducens TaxID=192843 RepID=UPI000E0CF4B1|nr:LysR family transcriptional regulator [Rhodoferax ferrireducens]